MALNSKIILCKDIEIDKDYSNVLSYTENQMLTLCNESSHKIAERNDYSFIRPTNSIFVDFTYAQCLQANYIAFQNTDYSSKWFFAWIDEVIYKSDKSCELKYTVDAWSTWFDYWTKKTCFVKREHVNDDTIGLHTVPENLDVGEVVETFEQTDSSYDITYGFYVAIETNYIMYDNSHDTSPLKGQQFSTLCVYNNCVSGSAIVLFPIINTGDINNVIRFIGRTNKDGYPGDIHNMYIVPNAVISAMYLDPPHTAYTDVNGTDSSFTFYTIGNSVQPESFNTTITKVNSYSGLTIKNNKCYCYPYNYFTVSNNNGGNNIYKYENFSTTNCVFENVLALVGGISGRIIPKNYKGMSKAIDESIPLGKYPFCSWSSDAYTNWLTQNAVNIPTSFINTGISASSKIMTGDFVSAAGDVANIIGGFYKAALMPNIIGGNNTGDVMWSSSNINFVFRGFRCKDEYMQIIDDYFSRYGYQINRVKLPNITGRTYWNYVEIGSNEEIGTGTVPANFMSTINNACRKGVTIWHNHANIGNFSLNNTIVS